MDTREANLAGTAQFIETALNRMEAAQKSDKDSRQLVRCIHILLRYAQRGGLSSLNELEERLVELDNQSDTGRRVKRITNHYEER